VKAEEQQLLRNLCDDPDGPEFENFYNRMATRWVRFLTNERGPYRLTPSEAQDAVQQAMLVIFSKVSTFDPAGTANFSTWCCGIAVKIAIGIYRERLKITYIADIEDYELLTAEPLNEELEAKPDIIADDEGLELWLKGEGAIQQALRSLKEEERQVVLLKAIRGLTHKDIANTLGKSAAAVRVQYHRAISKLKPIVERASQKQHGQRSHSRKVARGTPT
jgi:RNA polymerase sigma-70 factor, ECF subfamily